MSNEIKGVGNSYTAEFWEYDPRLGRRWNVDPIDLHIQSVYVAFNNNPIFYVDPKGLYATKRKAERMHDRALKAGRDVGDVRYREKQKDWVFDETKVEVRSNSDGTSETIATNTVFVNKRYFGSASQKIGDFFTDINPVESVEGYFGGLIKTEINLNKNAKLVVPYGGFQLKANYKEGNVGGDASIVDGRLSYLNVKVGNADFRVMPLNQIGGDYDPGVRLLYTMMSRPIIIPVGEIPVPIGEAKIQGDFQTSSNKTTIGLRGAAETFPIPSFQKGKSGIKLELNAGIRFELKVPDLFKD